jgi:hypothetical protein
MCETIGSRHQVYGAANDYQVTRCHWLALWGHDINWLHKGSEGHHPSGSQYLKKCQQPTKVTIIARSNIHHEDPLLIINQLLAGSCGLSPEVSSSDMQRAIVPRHTTPGSTPSNSRLYGSQGMALPPPAGTGMHHLLSKVELPKRHLHSPFALQWAEMLVTTEMTLVVAAIVLSTTVEIVTGQSLLDQISAFCSLHP